MTEPDEDQQPATEPVQDRGKTVHGAQANAGHRVLAPDDAEVVPPFQREHPAFL